MAACPYCEGEVSETAQKCAHCGEWLPGSPARDERDIAVAEQTIGARSLRLHTAAMAGGALLVAVGAFLAWATVSAGILSVSTTGMDGDGVITLVLALVVMGCAAGLLMRNGPPRALSIVGLLGAGIIIVVAVIDIADVRSVVDAGSTVSVSVGTGLWLTLVGGIAAAVGAVMAFKEARAQTPQHPVSLRSTSLQICPACGRSTGALATQCPDCGVAMGAEQGERAVD